MIKRVTYDGSVILENAKCDWGKLNSELEELDSHDDRYIVGIDFAREDSEDKSFMVSLKKTGDDYSFVKSEEL